MGFNSGFKGLITHALLTIFDKFQIHRDTSHKHYGVLSN